MLQSFVRNLVCQFVRPVFTSEEKITRTSNHHQTGTYYCRATKCYLFRSAQPLVGASNSRSASDEDFLKRIGGDEELCILDCRPRLNAFANQNWHAHCFCQSNGLPVNFASRTMFSTLSARSGPFFACNACSAAKSFFTLQSSPFGSVLYQSDLSSRPRMICLMCCRCVTRHIQP